MCRRSLEEKSRQEDQAQKDRRVCHLGSRLQGFRRWDNQVQFLANHWDGLRGHPHWSWGVHCSSALKSFLEQTCKSEAGKRTLKDAGSCKRWREASSLWQTHGQLGFWPSSQEFVRVSLVQDGQVVSHGKPHQHFDPFLCQKNDCCHLASPNSAWNPKF